MASRLDNRVAMLLK